MNYFFYCMAKECTTESLCDSKLMLVGTSRLYNSLCSL